MLALGLAGAMLCGMLTACGGANGSSSAPSASSEDRQSLQLETERRKVVRFTSVDRCRSRILG